MTSKHSETKPLERTAEEIVGLIGEVRRVVLERALELPDAISADILLEEGTNKPTDEAAKAVYDAINTELCIVFYAFEGTISKETAELWLGHKWFGSD